MKYHYDLSGGEPIIKDLRVYDASNPLYKGTLMAAGITGTAAACGCAVLARVTVLDNIIGVLMEDLTATELLSVVATGVDKYGKICINPHAIWLAKYNPTTIVTTTATPKILTQTMVTDHERGWAYVTSDGSSTGGFGNLFQIGASGTTATITAATSYDDNMLATTANTDTYFVMPAPFTADAANGSFNLHANGRDALGYGTAAHSGNAVPLENYITSKTRPMEPLVCAKHSGYNYRSENPSFYVDLFFPEHLLATGGAVGDRPIT